MKDRNDIFKFDTPIIPPEYEDKLLELIQSNDSNNWTLVYQLMKGFADIDEWNLDWYFRTIMDRCTDSIIINNAYNNWWTRRAYIQDKKWKH